MLVDKDGILAELYVFAAVGGVVGVSRIAVVVGYVGVTRGVFHGGYYHIGLLRQRRIARYRVAVCYASPVAVVAPLCAYRRRPNHRVGKHHHLEVTVPHLTAVCHTAGAQYLHTHSISVARAHGVGVALQRSQRQA